MHSKYYYCYYDQSLNDLTLIIKKVDSVYSEEIYNDIYLFRSESDDEIIGIQILYFSKRSTDILKRHLPKCLLDEVIDIKVRM